tara:strand:- start:1915 stop:2442 length:528 start_codon:yes stop_codon:yes gene_type:complete
MKRTKGIGPKGLGVMPSPGKSLEKVVKQLKGASQMHAKQAGMVQDHIDEMKSPNKLASPTKKKDACYAKVKSRYKKWPSAYASGALVKCRKVGAANWGNSSPAKQTKPPGFTDKLYIKAEKLQDKAGTKARKAAIAVDEGRDRKANRLYKKAARLENRGIKIEEREAKRIKKYKY